MDQSYENFSEGLYRKMDIEFTFFARRYPRQEVFAPIIFWEINLPRAKWDRKEYHARQSRGHFRRTGMQIRGSTRVMPCPFLKAKTVRLSVWERKT